MDCWETHDVNENLLNFTIRTPDRNIFVVFCGKGNVEGIKANDMMSYAKELGLYQINCNDEKENINTFENLSFAFSLFFQNNKFWSKQKSQKIEKKKSPKAIISSFFIMAEKIIIKHNLTVVPKGLSNNICDFFVNHSERKNEEGDPEWKFERALFNGEYSPHVRQSTKASIKKNDYVSLIWQGVKEHVPTQFQGRKLVGPDKTSFSILRYFPGDQFSEHRDGNTVDPDGNRSMMTVLIYLNKCEKGGETRFFAEADYGLNFNCGGNVFDCKPEKGKIVLMRHYLRHQALPVDEGVKYVIRFNVLFESHGPWYQGESNPEKKIGEVYPSHDRPLWAPQRVYFFLSYSGISETYEPGRLPIEGEDRCENCYEILDLAYDYNECPGCKFPVIFTQKYPITRF